MRVIGYMEGWFSHSQLFIFHVTSDTGVNCSPMFSQVRLCEQPESVLVTEDILPAERGSLGSFVAVIVTGYRCTMKGGLAIFGCGATDLQDGTSADISCNCDTNRRVLNCLMS